MPTQSMRVPLIQLHIKIAKNLYVRALHRKCKNIYRKQKQLSKIINQRKCVIVSCPSLALRSVMRSQVYLCTLHTKAALRVTCVT